jgi:hypothetical protein
MNNDKQFRYRKIFAKKRLERHLAVQIAIVGMAGDSGDSFASQWATIFLNVAAPLAIDLGNGWIKCNSFGAIQDGIIPYHPRERRKDCTALVIGIRLLEIKRIKII